jgi:peptidoglycan L-alanyl-D-glutamate endopeptidase CwlK
MSNIFGISSYRRLNTIHPALKVLCIAILERMDITVVCGYRGEEEQNEAYNEGKSGLKFPNSKHNHSPSSAVDIAPYIKGKGVRWNSAEVAYMW